MEKVRSIGQLQEMSAEIRQLGRGYLTNFFPDPVKHGLWIAKGDCCVERVGNTLFIVKQSASFANVFFCAAKDTFNVDLEAFLAAHKGETLLFDLVGRDVQCGPMVTLFKETGCLEASSLVRMTRKTAPVEATPDGSVREATEADLPAVSALLHAHFDARTEQLPYDEELLDLVRRGQILLCEETAGFLIYEKTAGTYYLRYWFTHPEHRNQKVGSRLLRRFLREGEESVRQILWVIRSNENAIVRYRHYGFEAENMYDFVMQYN